MSIYTIFKHAHSGLRWLALAVLLFVIITSLQKWLSDSKEEGSLPTFSKINLSLAHLQLLIGIALIFMSPLINWAEGFMKQAASRFFHIEHPTMMVLAVVLITIGHAKGKRKLGVAKYKTLFWFNLIALLIILAMIPWPFRGLGAGWF